MGGKSKKDKVRDPDDARVAVSKTYKLFVGGKFVRSESGHCWRAEDHRGQFLANIAEPSRKDFRDAVAAARKAHGGWARRSAFNRSQVLFRLAEQIEVRRGAFEHRLEHDLGFSSKDASAEVDAAVERVFWYAGWADKYGQVLGGVNPVASPFFDFSVPEPMGVVALFASRKSPLCGLVSALSPVICSGNAAVVITDGAPTVAIELAETIATSDVPGGVVNLLTGSWSELIGHAATHMDVNALAGFGFSAKHQRLAQEGAAENVKRVRFFDDPSPGRWRDERMASLYWIEPFVEIKTAWHPIGT